MSQEVKSEFKIGHLVTARYGSKSISKPGKIIGMYGEAPNIIYKILLNDGVEESFPKERLSFDNQAMVLDLIAELGLAA